MKARYSQRESEVWGGFLSTYAFLDQAIDADLRAHDGVSHVEFEVLLRLWRAPQQRLRIQELAAASLLTRSGTSRLVDRLVGVGLIAREPDPADGRASLAVLTAAGQELFERAAPRHMTLVRELFLSRLTDAEADALTGVWAKVADR